MKRLSNKCSKNRKNNEFNKILHLEREKVKKGFVLAKNTGNKYRHNRQNNKCNKNQDLEKEEAKKGPEMSANIAKIAKITEHFPC